MFIEFLLEEAHRRGEIKGEKKGEAKFGKLVSALLKENRYSDIEKVSSDEIYREELYKEFNM